MNDSIASWLLIVIFLVFIFDGDPDIYDLAKAKIIQELKQ